MGYRPRWPWMTLNDIERRNSPYLAFFTEFDNLTLLANYVTLQVENRPIMSAKYSLPVPVVHFWTKVTHLAERSFCDSWATCFTAPQLFGRCMSEMSVRLSKAWIVTKRKKLIPTLLYHRKTDTSSFATRIIVGEGCPFLPEILNQSDRPSKRRFPIYIRS